MPANNSVKSYRAESFYHLYNRGVEKRSIFLDQQDYTVFLSYLKTYLLPKDLKSLNKILSSTESTYKDKDQAAKLLRLNNFSDEIELHAYVLMPNHFHFLIKQKNIDSIDRFLNSLATRYAMYFNKKYKRVGVLFQNVYKAVLVESDEQLLHLSRYIHLNPLGKLKGTTEKPIEDRSPSSLLDYLGKRKTNWIKTETILNYFSKTNPKNNYLSFLNLPQDFESIAKISLDLDD